METPSSTKRVTRSQTFSALNNTVAANNIPISRKVEDSEKGVSKSRRRNATQQHDRSALIDISNDSPIVGLAMGILETPSSVKQRNSGTKNNTTPGSGEALLRGQVKTLLQRVEEEAVLSKISLANRPFLHLQGLSSSPMRLVAPTPANTPQVPYLSGDDSVDSNGLASATLPVVEEQLKICQQVVTDVFDVKKQESLESQKSLTRSLLLDFSEKSESSDSSELSSVMTYQEVEEVASECKNNSYPAEDDNDSIWSIQVNASTHDEEEEDFNDYEDEEGGGEEDEVEEEEKDDDGGLVDLLCERMSMISVNEKTKAKFTGKHTKFVYNSDDEIVEAVECAESDNSAGGSPGVLHLKGLPTPTGKHLRFSMEEEQEQDQD